MNYEETIEEHVYGEVLHDRIIEAKRDYVNEDKQMEKICRLYGKKLTPTEIYNKWKIVCRL